MFPKKSITNLKSIENIMTYSFNNHKYFRVLGAIPLNKNYQQHSFVAMKEITKIKMQ